MTFTRMCFRVMKSQPLPYDLEQHIPLKLNKPTIKTEFEVRVCGIFQKAILVSLKYNYKKHIQKYSLRTI